MHWYLDAMRKYFVFDGRSQREAFWYFTLVNSVFAIIAAITDSILGITFGDSPYGLISFLYLLAVLCPSLALSVRRLHDIDKSAWYILLAMIPVVGPIWLLVLYCQRGTGGDNRFGLDPLADTVNSDFRTNPMQNNDFQNEMTTPNTQSNDGDFFFWDPWSSSRCKECREPRF